MKKKFVSLLLAAALVFSLGVPAFAEGAEALPAEPEAAVAETEPETTPEDETNEVVVTLGDTVTATTTEQAPAADTKTTAPAADSTKETAADTESTEQKQITYVALGDSIVAGVGLADVQYSANGTSTYGVDMSPNFKGYSPDCYVGKVASKLGLDRDHAIDLGLPALTAPDLVDMVRDGKMPQMNMESGCYYVYPEFQDYLRKADVISIQIGSNDAFVPCVAGLWNATNHKSDALASTILKCIKDMELTKEEKNASWKLITSDMAKICDRIYPQTTSALISVVQEIRKLNPDAQILLMGYTDPVPFIPCWHNYFRKLNKFEKQLAETYDLTYVAIPRAKTDLDVHPTIQGHEYIANKIVNAIDVKAE